MVTEFVIIPYTWPWHWWAYKLKELSHISQIYLRWAETTSCVIKVLWLLLVLMKIIPSQHDFIWFKTKNYIQKYDKKYLDVLHEYNWVWRHYVDILLFLLLGILMVNRRMKDMVRWEEVQEVKLIYKFNLGKVIRPVEAQNLEILTITA